MAEQINKVPWKSFFARIVALGKDRSSVIEGLEQAKKTIESTIGE